jgi:hypothetical protein
VIKTLLKIAVAATILVLIARRVDFAAALGLMRSADPFWIAASIAASLLIIAADAAFWAGSMRPAGLTMNFRTGLLFGIVSWFFVNIAPSTIGADLFRAAQMRAAGATTARSIRLVAAARLMSFAALIAVIGAGLPIAFEAFDSPRDRLALAAIFAISLICLAGLILGGPLLGKMPTRFRRGPLAFAAELSADARLLLRRTGPEGWFFLLVQHLLRFAGVLCIAASLGENVDAAALFALVPSAFLAAMIPISFGGWGVREASFVYFLGVAGIDAPAALAISILFGLTRILIGGAGGLLWLIARKEHFSVGIEPGAGGAAEDVRTTS